MDEEVLKRIECIAKPILENLGFELIDLEYVVHLGRQTLRLVVDRICGGINVGDCAKISRTIEDVIAIEDIIDSRYDLEVSSPGLDRPLKTENDFKAHIGDEIKLKTLEPIEGRRNYKGILEFADDKEVAIVVDGIRYHVPFDQVEKARLIPEIGQIKKKQ